MLSEGYNAAHRAMTRVKGGEWRGTLAMAIFDLASENRKAGLAMASNLDRLEDLISNQIIADLEPHLTEMLLSTRAVVEELKAIKVEKKSAKDAA